MVVPVTMEIVVVMGDPALRGIPGGCEGNRRMEIVGVSLKEGYLEYENIGWWGEKRQGRKQGEKRRTRDRKRGVKEQIC